MVTEPLSPDTIPARGSLVEFGLFSEPGVSNYNHEMEDEFNFIDATTQGVENWKDEFEITIQLESVGGDDFGGVNEIFPSFTFKFFRQRRFAHPKK